MAAVRPSGMSPRREVFIATNPQGAERGAQNPPFSPFILSESLSLYPQGLERPRGESMGSGREKSVFSWLLFPTLKFKLKVTW